MKANEAKIFKEKLTKEKERLIRGLDTREKNSLGKSLRDLAGEVSSYKIHMADIASDNAEEDTSLDLLSSEEKLLIKIQKALIRIDKGIYGKCLKCKKNVSMKRLKAVPYAELCRKCQEKEEKR
jgi:DnaK suppressor protein